ncbi:MAG: NAD(P)H-dependent oxidoreductase, partial [Notoacmeibacter sp.]
MSVFRNPPKPRRVLVLNGHPDKQSLNGALAETAAKASEQNGYETRIMHLGEMSFNPDLAHGYNARVELEEDLLAFQEALLWCDTFVLVHPLWWGSCPAKLK